MLLLCAASIVGERLNDLAHVDLGVRGDDAIVADVTPASRDAAIGFARRVGAPVEAALGSLPGIRATGIIDHLPGDRREAGHARQFILDDGLARSVAPSALVVQATAAVFGAIGIDLLAGRTFSAEEMAGTQQAVIVDERLARLWGLTPAEMVGRRIAAGGVGETFRPVVGVVRDVRMQGPSVDATSAVYMPFARILPGTNVHVVVKTRLAAATVVPAIRRILGQIDPDLPMHDVRTLDDIRASYLADRRFVLAALGGFGALGLGVAILGLYSVISYLVQLRNREIGIRLALGASPSQVRADVMARGAAHAASGVAAGTAAAMLGWLALSHVLPDFGRIDPVLIAGQLAVIFAIATAATWLPAQRATRVDPLAALRCD